MPSVEDNSLKNEQDHSVEAEPGSSIPSQLEQPKETPIILEKSESESHQEGIGDAFSQDHRDRFQSKNEKTNKVESGVGRQGVDLRPSAKEKPDA